MSFSTPLRSQIPRTSLIVLAFIALSCARQIGPEGGPRDVAGPIIVSTYPAPFTTSFKDNVVEFEFDEYVDQRSFEESVFFTPSIKEYEFSWTGHRVEIEFLEPLRDSTTYVITIGTDVTDYAGQPRNRMGESFTLAFSTGPTIDRGLLAGRVYDISSSEGAFGVMVLAYRIDGARFDTLNPQTTLPTYITQTGKDGSFQLPHIKLGTYAVMAERDEFRNVVYDREADAFAVMDGTIRISEMDTSRTSIVLQLAKEDTTGPRIAKFDPMDRNHLIVDFSEPIDTSAHRNMSATIVDTLSGKELSVYAIVFRLPDLKTATLVTDFQKPEGAYAVNFRGVFDTVGNSGSVEGLTRGFIAPDKTDSAMTRVKNVSMRDSTRDVDLNAAIRIEFSEPIIPGTFQLGLIQLMDGEGMTLPITLEWFTPAVVGIKPSATLTGLTWHTLRVLYEGVQDWKNSQVRDSILVVHFETMDPDEAGSVEGTVEDLSISDTLGSIIVIAHEVDVKIAKSFSARASRDGRFAVGGLPQGRVLLSAYRDRNNNGRFDAGLPYPFQPSERRSNVTDTLKVRVRWPLEGVKIVLP